MPLPMALLLSDWSERSYRQARPDINFMRNDLHKVVMKNLNVEFMVHNRYKRKHHVASFEAVKKPKMNETSNVPESKSEKFDKFKHVLEPGQNSENAKIVSKAFNILMGYTLLHDTPLHTKSDKGNHPKIHQKSEGAILYSNSKLPTSANCESKYKKFSPLSSPLKTCNSKTLRSKYIQNKIKKTRTTSFRSNGDSTYRDNLSWRQSNHQQQYSKSDSQPKCYNTQQQQSSEPSTMKATSYLLNAFPKRQNISPLTKKGNNAVTALPSAGNSSFECPPSILDAVSNTNININSIMRGYSMDTICPFMFFGSKKFDEEIAMHKVLYASRRAFLDQIPQYVDTRREVRAPGIEAAPEIHAARRSMLDRASSSKLSVHAPPFTLKTRCSTKEKERTTQEVGDAFYKFVSSLDEPTLRSLAPTPSCSTTPVPAEEDEQEGAVGYDTSREQDNKKDDPTQTQLTSVEEPNEVPQLDGQRLSEEEEEQQAENALAAHGPVGGQAVVEPAAAAAAVPPPPEDDPATYVIEARTTIIYQDRNILNLDDNVLGQWRDRNRWGRGPDPARAFSYRNAFYAYDPNNESLLPPMFGCYYCETNTEPELPKPPQQPEVPKP